MKSENRDHVAISSEYGASWAMILPSSAESGREQMDEVMDTISSLFNAFDGFLQPIELTYLLREYPRGQTPLEHRENAPSRELERHLYADSGITFDAFADSTRIEVDGTKWIPRVPFEHNKITIRFEDGDREIDRQQCIQYRRGEPTTQKPSWDPLEVSLSFIPNYTYKEVDSDFLLLFGVSLCSDIWFHQSDIGETNRTYLADFLDRIWSTVPVEMIEREVYETSDMWSDVGMTDYATEVELQDIY